MSELKKLLKKLADKLGVCKMVVEKKTVEIVRYVCGEEEKN